MVVDFHIHRKECLVARGSNSGGKYIMLIKRSRENTRRSLADLLMSFKLMLGSKLTIASVTAELNGTGLEGGWKEMSLH